MIDTICLKNIKHTVNDDFLCDPSSDNQLLKNIENVGKLKLDLHFHKNDEKAVLPNKKTNQQLLENIIHPIGQ